MTDLSPEHRARLVEWGKAAAAEAPPLPSGALAALAPLRAALAERVTGDKA